VRLHETDWGRARSPELTAGTESENGSRFSEESIEEEKEDCGDSGEERGSLQQSIKYPGL
jgi:hypothetical protein